MSKRLQIEALKHMSDDPQYNTRQCGVCKPINGECKICVITKYTEAHGIVPYDSYYEPPCSTLAIHHRLDGDKDKAEIQERVNKELIPWIEKNVPDEQEERCV